MQRNIIMIERNYYASIIIVTKVYVCLLREVIGSNSTTVQPNATNTTFLDDSKCWLQRGGGVTLGLNVTLLI